MDGRSAWIPARTIFVAGSDACLRGPLQFFDDKGDVIFKLEAGAEFPTGCIANQKASK